MVREREGERKRKREVGRDRGGERERAGEGESGRGRERARERERRRERERERGKEGLIYVTPKKANAQSESLAFSEIADSFAGRRGSEVGRQSDYLPPERSFPCITAAAC
jgi:hypothetical protein